MEEKRRWITLFYEIDFNNRWLTRKTEINNFQGYEQVIYQREEVADKTGTEE